MLRHYIPHTPKTVAELMDQLGFMILKSPTFEDPAFPGRNVETVFRQLNDGLRRVRQEIGEDRYERLIDLSAQVRACFEGDPGSSTSDGAASGRRLIYEMRAILEPLA